MMYMKILMKTIQIKKCKILMIKVLDDKIADMSSNKKLNPTVT